jgi:hypothetical protein
MVMIFFNFVIFEKGRHCGHSPRAPEHVATPLPILPLLNSYHEAESFRIAVEELSRVMGVTADNSGHVAYGMRQGCTNSGRQFVVGTEFSIAVPNI